MNIMSNTRLAIVLPMSDKKQLEAIAAREDRSISSIIRRVLGPFLKEQAPLITNSPPCSREYPTMNEY